MARTDQQKIRGYILGDALAALAAWQLFSVFRFYECRSTIYFGTLSSYLFYDKAYALSLLMPVFWVLLYAFLGYYTQPRRKNDTDDLNQTLSGTFIGSLIIFFTVIINDYPEEYTQFYTVFAGLFLIHFFCLLMARFIRTTHYQNLHAKGLSGISALIVGCGEEAAGIDRYLTSPKNKSVYLSAGFVRTEASEPVKVDPHRVLGSLDCLPELLRQHPVESFIVACDQRDDEALQTVVNRLYPYHLEIHTTLHPSEVLFSDVALYSVAGVPLRPVTPIPMKAWEQHVKRLADLLVASIGLVLLSPLMAYLTLRVRLDSKGSAFYTQERLGKGGKPFRIIKFRTMYTDAEANGPLLSSVDDVRITRVGRVMRKYRLDELPQLWNVLRGDMSLVGPRPERSYYARRILEQAPHYELIYSVRPGITSLGMVRFGYADTVEKMVDRLHFDLIYLKNQSLIMDLKILLFTIKPLALGKGV